MDESYSLPGVLAFLLRADTQRARAALQWELERAVLQTQVAQLQSDKARLERACAQLEARLAYAERLAQSRGDDARVIPPVIADQPPLPPAGQALEERLAGYVAELSDALETCAKLQALALRLPQEQVPPPKSDSSPPPQPKVTKILRPPQRASTAKAQKLDFEPLRSEAAAAASSAAEQSSDASSRVWALKSTVSIHLDSVRSIDFHADEPLLVTGSEDGTAKLWSLASANPETACLYTYRGHQDPLTNVAFLKHEGEVLVGTASIDSLIKIWRIPDVDKESKSNRPSLLYGSLIGHSDVIWQVLQVPGLPLIASCASDGCVKVWSLASMELVSSYKLPAAPTRMALVGAELVIGLTNGDIARVPLDGDAVETVSTGRTERVSAVAAGRGDGVVYAGFEGGHIAVFDLRSGTTIKEIAGAHSDAVSSIETRGDDHTFLSAGHDCSVKVWDAKSHTCVQEWSHHRRKWDEGAWEVRRRRGNAAYGADVVATCGADGLVKLYEQQQ